jgi:ATPase subunit of ABC transporter with duplicated ATPase domains
VGERKDIQAAASKRAKLERHHNDLLVMEKVEKELSRELESLISEREKMLEKLSDLRDKRYFIRKETAEKISKEFYPNIRATVIQGAGTELYHASLEHFLKPCGVRLETVVKKLVDAFPPESLIDIVRKNDQRALIEIGGLNESQAAKIMGALSEPDIQCKLEIVELRDEPKIELNDNEHYKETTALSTGQKCTVILPILLLDSENPLLIDQPEDNLDNRFIFETIVEKVKEIKSHRQLFFVTHNPNIPALGDAERIFVMESDGANAKKIREGNVDDCKSDIITLLEGGEEAFRERQRRYSS